MSQDTTRRLLRELGVSVTGFEDAVEAKQVEAARKAEGLLREHRRPAHASAKTRKTRVKRSLGGVVEKASTVASVVQRRKEEADNRLFARAHDFLR